MVAHLLAGGALLVLHDDVQGDVALGRLAHLQAVPPSAAWPIFWPAATSILRVRVRAGHGGPHLVAALRCLAHLLAGGELLALHEDVWGGGGLICWLPVIARPTFGRRQCLLIAAEPWPLSYFGLAPLLAATRATTP